jgi:hypothetical protein
MFGWFSKILEALGLVSQGLDEVNATLDKAAEPASKVDEIRDKAKNVERKYRKL